MSNNNKRHLIIIAATNEKDDLAFYKTILRHDNPLIHKAIILMFSTVSQFLDYINSQADTYSFSLLIHVGNRTLTKGEDANLIVRELMKSPIGKNIAYEFTSRDGDDTYKGINVHHTNKLPDDVDINKLPLNTMGVIRNGDNFEKENSNKYDVAIITALYDDEHKSFDSNMKSHEVSGQKNIKIGKFLEAKDFPDDYRGDILLTWQQDLGMVDAAAFSSRIIALFPSKFLIMGGVCGGRINDVNIYDIIIPRNILDYMSGKYNKGVFEPRPLRAEPNQELIDYLFRRKDDILTNMRKLAPTNIKSILDSGFKIHFKNYACGPWIVKTQGALLEIAKHFDDDIVGLEMESLGVIRSGKLFNKNHQYCFVVKSVMDFTDENKTDGTGGNIKNNASIISYLCIRALIPLILEFEDPKL